MTITDAQHSHDADNRTPSASVLMTVYNEKSAVLKQALDSILAQTHTDFELLIMDDGSTNADTINLLKQYQKLDSRVKTVFESHAGQTHMLNIGISLCKGQLILRHDSDDWSSPERFAKQLRFMNDNPAIGLCGTSVQFHEESGKPLWKHMLPQTREAIAAFLEVSNPFCHGSTCFRKDLGLQLGGYNEVLQCAQDRDFFWRMFERAGGTNLPDILYHYRYTCGSLMASRAKDIKADSLTAEEAAKLRRQGHIPDYRAIRDTVMLRLAQRDDDISLHLTHHDRILLAGYHMKAICAFTKTAITHPSSKACWFKLIRAVIYSCLPTRLRARLYQ